MGVALGGMGTSDGGGGDEGIRKKDTKNRKCMALLILLCANHCKCHTMHSC